MKRPLLVPRHLFPSLPPVLLSPYRKLDQRVVDKEVRKEAFSSSSSLPFNALPSWLPPPALNNDAARLASVEELGERGGEKRGVGPLCFGALMPVTR